MSRAEYGNVPLLYIEFVFEFKLDIMKAVVVDLSAYESIR